MKKLAILMSYVLVSGLIAPAWTVARVAALEDDKKPSQTVQKKFANLLKDNKAAQFMAPFIGHTLKRYVARMQPGSKIEREFFAYLDRKLPAGRISVQPIVDRFNALPQSVIKQFDASYANLSIGSPFPEAELIKRIGTIPVARVPRPKLGVADPERLLKALVPPKISDAVPAALDFVLKMSPGAEFKLVGRNFGTDASRVKVDVFRMIRGVEIGERISTLSASRVSTAEVYAVGPAIPAGQYGVQVIREGITSNIWPAFVDAPPAPGPVLERIGPSANYPNGKVTLTGGPFDTGLAVFLESLDMDGYRTSRVGPRSIIRLNDRQVDFIIPNEVLPGEYRLSVANPGTAPSLFQNLTVKAPHYAVTTTRVTCLDESDPETIVLLGNVVSDEIRFMYSPVVDGVGLPANFTSQEIDGFDDGTIKEVPATMSKALPAKAVATVPVSRQLAVAIGLFEADMSALEISIYGGIAAVITEGLVVALLAGLAVPGAGWIATVAAGVLAAIVAIWAALEAEDPLGSAVITKDAIELQTETVNVGGEIRGTLNYMNDDDTGSYKVEYVIKRTHPH